MITTKFTKAIRQKIVREFAVRHNGHFNPALFLEEVRAKGPTHPAYDWFTWDRDAAAREHWLSQARAFASDLRVTFRVEEVVGPHSVRVRETPMPMVLSSLDNRSKGGGYMLVDPDDPEHIAEHCRQAAQAMNAWLNRYEAAIAHARVKRFTIESVVSKLEDAAAKPAAA